MPLSAYGPRGAAGASARAEPDDPTTAVSASDAGVAGMAMPSPTRSPTVRSERDVLGFVTRTHFTTGPPGRVGVESEWFVVDDANPRAAVALPRVRSLIDAGGPLPAGSTVTFEPGGQVELSTAPAAGSAQAIDMLARDVWAVAARLRAAGLGLVAAGTDPLRPPRRVLDEPRYAAMETFFDGDGPAGRAMMSTTAAVQICLDAGATTADVAQRWRLANDLTPVLVAAFANSPLHRGAPTGLRSTRMAFWQRLDPSRTRPPQGEDPVEAYARYALDARVMLCRRDGGAWQVDPGVTFREWVAGALPSRPTEDDLAYHLTTLFPPVRPRAWLELRAVDALPLPWWPVAVAAGAALLDDPVCRDAAAAAVVPVTGRLEQAIRLGASDPPLRRAAGTCLEAAADALRRDPGTTGLAGGVEAYLERFTARGRCPADDVLDAYRRGAPPWRAATASARPAASIPVAPTPAAATPHGPTPHGEEEPA